MILAKDFEDFIKLLNKHKVTYLIIGGYALGFHGKPRHTGDLDIWIDVSEKNATSMMKVLKDFGLGTLGFTKIDFMQEGYVTQIGYPPLRIDILTSIDGVNFATAYVNKLSIDLDGFTAWYIGLHELIKNKEATGRSQDKTDVKQLKQIKPKRNK
jgi:predicted nucleotidyltransferase